MQAIEHVTDTDQAPVIHNQDEIFLSIPLFQSGSKCPRVQCSAIKDIYGDNLLHSERGILRIGRLHAQVRLLEADLMKAARHSVFEPRLFGCHKERPHISAIGSHGGSDMFDITFCHPHSPSRVRDGMENALNLLKKAWDKEIRTLGRILHESAAAVKLFPVPLSTPGD